MPHKPLLYMFSRDQDSIDYSTNMENYTIDYMAMFFLQQIIVVLPDTLQATGNNDLRCMWAMVWKKPLVTRSSRKCGFRRSKKQVSQRKKGPWLFRLYTPPKFNIAPEKWWLEDEFPFGIVYF